MYATNFLPGPSLGRASTIRRRAHGQSSPPGRRRKEVAMNENEKMKESNDVQPPEVPAAPDQRAADDLIRNRVYASMALGFVPVPLVDLGALAAIQTEMVYRLGKMHGVTFNRDWGRKAVTFVLGALAPVAFTPGVGSLLRYVPVVGLGLSGASSSLTFGAATYVVGQAFARRFARGQVISKEDLTELGQEIKADFEKGRQKVKGWISGDKKNAAVTTADAPA